MLHAPNRKGADSALIKQRIISQSSRVAMMLKLNSEQTLLSELAKKSRSPPGGKTCSPVQPSTWWQCLRYFPNAYSNSPLCVPARTSMMAGRYNSDIKVWDNFIGIASVNGDNSNLDQRRTVFANLSRSKNPMRQ